MVSSYKSISTRVRVRVHLSMYVNSTFAPCVQGNLEQIQSVLNSTEVGLHQLTALVDCRSLHMVSHFVGCVREERSSNLGLYSATDSFVSLLAGLCSGIDWAVL